MGAKVLCRSDLDHAGETRVQPADRNTQHLRYYLPTMVLLRDAVAVLSVEPSLARQEPA